MDFTGITGCAGCNNTAGPGGCPVHGANRNVVILPPPAPLMAVEVREMIERLQRDIIELQRQKAAQYEELHEMAGRARRAAYDAEEKLRKANLQYRELKEAADWALRGLEQLARDEAERRGTTFEMCDYTFAKGLRFALKGCQHVYKDYQCEKCGKGQDVEKRVDERK